MSFRLPNKFLWLSFLIIFLSLGCESHRRFARPGSKPGAKKKSALISTKIQRGVASYYAHKFHGRKTANGETYNMHALTAAHKTLPFHSKVLVRNLDNGKEINVRINDRGPFVKGRIIDLSLEAAKRISMIGPGHAKVELRIQLP